MTCILTAEQIALERHETQAAIGHLERRLAEERDKLQGLQSACLQLGHPGRQRIGGYPGGFTVYRCDTCGAEFEE